MQGRDMGAVWGGAPGWTARITVAESAAGVHWGEGHPLCLCRELLLVGAK